MSRVDRSGRARVREAEDLLVGLALPGTDAHTALRHLRSDLDATHRPTGTAHAWPRYLRWLAAILDRVASVGAVSGAVRGEWDRAGAACVQARGVWDAVAATLADSDAACSDHATTAQARTHLCAANPQPVGAGADGFDPAGERLCPMLTHTCLRANMTPS